MLKKALQNLESFIDETSKSIKDSKEVLDFILLNKPLPKKKKLKYDEYTKRMIEFKK
jgi:hypothetical protein